MTTKWTRTMALGAGLAILGAAAAGAQGLSDAFDRVSNSVVAVSATQKERPGPGPLATVDGSGVLVDRLGVILTAAHLVQAAEAITVRFHEGEDYKATVIASDPYADVAALKLERVPPRNAVVAKLADSDSVRVGEQVFVVGAPPGMSHTLSVGYVGALRKANQVWGGLSEAELFQTDATIDAGNSGGPMFNLAGEVIGIVSSRVSEGGDGTSFVVTSNVARRLVLEERSLWSGFEGYLLTGDLAKAFNLPQDYGILVQRVADNSPASRIGLQPGTIQATIGGEELTLGGDILIEAFGLPVSAENRAKILGMAASIVPGEKIHVTVLRGGQRQELEAVVIPPS